MNLPQCLRVPTPLLTVSCPPHVHCGRTLFERNLETLLALAPALVMAVVAYGPSTVRVTALCASVAVLVEHLCWKLMHRRSEIDDGSALVTGVLFAFLLPASAPWWLAALGSALTLAIGKMIFGGSGGGPLCAPAVGWVICRISWPDLMDTNTAMLVSALPAPLFDLKHFGPDSMTATNLDLLLGHQLSGLGAGQVLGLLAGGLYLLARGWIRLWIPFGFLAGVAGTATVYWLLGQGPTPLFQLLAGGTVFGAFFLATDTSSSPVGTLPMLLFGLLGGTLLVVVRTYGVYPDGVAFAVLLANLLSPHLDRIRPRPFGMRRAGRRP